MEYQAQYKGTDLEFGGYKITDETVTNDRNKVVNKNHHLVGKARYEHWEENGTGIALQNATLCKDLIVGIPNMAARYPSMSRCRKDSFDMFQPEDYDG